MSLIPHHDSEPQCMLCEQKLILAHPDLQKWYREQVKPCFPDSHISWSYRNALEQEQALHDGKTHRAFPDSAHNKTPALALDLFQIDEAGRAKWDLSFFSAVNQLNEKAAPQIYWGGHWHHLGDNDHFELKL